MAIVEWAKAEDFGKRSTYIFSDIYNKQKKMRSMIFYTLEIRKPKLRLVKHCSCGHLILKPSFSVTQGLEFIWGIMLSTGDRSDSRGLWAGTPLEWNSRAAVSSQNEAEAQDATS